MAGNDPAKSSIEEMHQCRGGQQRRRLHVGIDDKESGKITKQPIQIHEQALTLPSASYYTQSPLK